MSRNVWLTRFFIFVFVEAFVVNNLTLFFLLISTQIEYKIDFGGLYSLVVFRI